MCVYRIEWIVYNREEELRLLQMIVSILRLPLVESKSAALILSDRCKYIAHEEVAVSPDEVASLHVL